MSFFRTTMSMTMYGVTCLMMICAVSVDATVQVDLRFANGSKTMVVTPGDFVIDVWVQVTGTDPAKRDGLLYVYGSAQSAQVNGGTVTPGTGVGFIGNTAAGGFTITPPYGSPGIPQDIQLDYLQDWGTAGPLNDLMIKYNSIGISLDGIPGLGPIYVDTPGVTAHAIPNGSEFNVGQLTFHINQVNYGAFAVGGATQVNWVTVDGPVWARNQISYPDETAQVSNYVATAPNANPVIFTAALPAAGYSYTTAAGSPKIAKVQLPDVGGGTFDLYAPADEVITPPAAPGIANPGLASAPGGGDDWVLIASGVTAGSLFALPYPVSDLQIWGISAAAAIDPNDTSAFPVDFVFEGGAAGSVTRVALVPEPASLALLGLAGMVGLLRRGRRV